MSWRKLARNWLLAFIDPSRLRGVIGLGRYLSHWRQYSKLAGYGAIRWYESYPRLTDWTSYTPFDNHYFYQSNWAARKLCMGVPPWHVDVGSSIMFIGVVCAITPTIFVDYRPLHAQTVGLTSIGGDLLKLPFSSNSVCSLSCLHVIEHIGLGRYGDVLDPEGSAKAARELTRVLAPKGRLLLSTPLGRERIQFNAHRVFEPSTVLNMFSELSFQSMAIVDDAGRFYAVANPNEPVDYEYGCGMFEFLKRE